MKPFFWQLGFKQIETLFDTKRHSVESATSDGSVHDRYNWGREKKEVPCSLSLSDTDTGLEVVADPFSSGVTTVAEQVIQNQLFD
jgi:hypothetical protein